MHRVARFMLLLCALLCPRAWGDTVEARFPRNARHNDNVFSRMFQGLPAFAAQNDRVRNAAQLLGAKDGLLDAQDDTATPNNPDNLALTTGFTFFGQFLDHDITLDRRSQLLKNAEPGRTVNFRTAAFDLDSLYGEGPEQSPEMYDTSDGDIKFRVDQNVGSEAVSRGGVRRFDLPRGSDGEALIGDSRNDENLVISQFHMSMLRFHNAVIDHVRAKPRNQGASAERVFEQARKLVQWHYQWVIVHEFLPRTIGQDRVDSIMREGPRHFRFLDRRAGGPLMPIEFSVAAYRFGHSQIRPGYRVNLGPAVGAETALAVFNDTIDPLSADPNDLRGGKRAPRRFVDWQAFFVFPGDNNARNNKRIDSKLSSPLFSLPGTAAPAPGLPADGVQSLASRNLIRHVNFGIPSGQAIASRLRVQRLTAEQLAELQPYAMDKSTPLWYYILKEAELLEGGARLGPVGAHIVGEVFIGLLKSDRDSYLSANPRWRPTLPSASGTFKITDLLNFAGVVVAP